MLRNGSKCFEPIWMRWNYRHTLIALLLQLVHRPGDLNAFAKFQIHFEFSISFFPFQISNLDCFSVTVVFLATEASWQNLSASLKFELHLIRCLWNRRSLSKLKAFNSRTSNLDSRIVTESLLEIFLRHSTNASLSDTKTLLFPVGLVVKLKSNWIRLIIRSSRTIQWILGRRCSFQMFSLFLYLSKSVFFFSPTKLIWR